VANLPPVATGINDSGGKFATGVNDTGGKFDTGVNDAGGKLPLVSRTPAANLPPMSMPPEANTTPAANISANFQKNSKRPLWYNQELGETDPCKKSEVKFLVALSL
jgi:hypothetical protein